VRSRLAESQLGCKLSEAQGRAKRRLRSVVTGNPDKKSQGLYEGGAAG